MPVAFLTSCPLQRSWIVQIRLGLAGFRQGSAGGEVVGARHEEFFGWKARDDLAAIFCYDDLLFEAGRRPAVRGRPVSFEREDHPLFDDLRMVQRNKAAEDGLLPDR